MLPVSQDIVDAGALQTGLLTAWIDLLKLTPLSASTLKGLPRNKLTTVFDDHSVIVSRWSAAEQWVGRGQTGVPPDAQAILERQGFSDLFRRPTG